MSEMRDVLGTPAIGGVEAHRKPRLKDGIAYMEAIEAAASMTEQLKQARNLLLGMGFPPELVDDLDVDAVVEYATRFFSAAFQRTPNGNGSTP